MQRAASTIAVPHERLNEHRTRCDQAPVRHTICVDLGCLVRSRSRWHKLRRQCRRIRAGNRNDPPPPRLSEVGRGCSGDRIRRILPVVRPNHRRAKGEVCFGLGGDLGALVRIPPTLLPVDGTTAPHRSCFNSPRAGKPYGSFPQFHCPPTVGPDITLSKVEAAIQFNIFQRSARPSRTGSSRPNERCGRSGRQGSCPSCAGWQKQSSNL